MFLYILHLSFGHLNPFIPINPSSNCQDASTLRFRDPIICCHMTSRYDVSVGTRDPFIKTRQMFALSYPIKGNVVT